MKWILTLMCVGIAGLAIGQKGIYNVKKGFVAEGYDVVSYFDGHAMEGDADFVSSYEGVKFKFSSQENLEKFESHPEKYLPQYGGWCAYAVAENNSKVDINPETFEIRDGKLYLFYNAFFNNTLESWLEEQPDKLVEKADKNWTALKDK